MPEAQVTPRDLVDEYTQANPRSRAAFERASRVLPGGLTHDVRHLVPFLPYIARAQGARKWDLDGHEYVDYAMGHGALILGHAHPEIVEAVGRQVALGTHPGANHPLEIEWAERIHRLVPGAELIRFTSSGTEATLLALRLARAATGRSKIVKFRGHFHGWHDAVMPGAQNTNVPDGLPPGVSPAIAEETLVLPTNLETVRTAVRDEPQMAAIIVEPSGASFGTAPLPAGFLRGLRDITTDQGICLIFDEVITGFRWAPGGIQQTSGVTADLVTMAKILGGGLPGGAVAGRGDLLERIAAPDDNERVRHPGTFNANPLSAAAGAACLDIVGDPAVQAGCDRTAAALRRGINDLFARRGVCGVAYGESSTLHLAFDARLIPGNPDALHGASLDELKAQRSTAAHRALTIAMLLEGVHIFGGGGFVSVAHGDTEVMRTLGALDAALDRVDGVLPIARSR